MFEQTPIVRSLTQCSPLVGPVAVVASGTKDSSGGIGCGAAKPSFTGIHWMTEMQAAAAIGL